MVTKRRWVVPGGASLILLGLSLVIFRVRGGKAAPDVRPEVGYLAPDFALPDLDGKTVRPSDFRGGKAIFLNFWATWCIPCRQEAPVLEATWREYRDRGVMFVGVDYLDTETEARKYLVE